MDLNRNHNLEVQKDKILGFIDANGPSLPIHISRYLKIDSMLSSAFLADLLSDKQVNLSNMRVGNSPIYYIRGQEFQLEKFSNFLSGKEREVFHLLKEKKVLRDDRMLPATRVALRAIRDFSFSFDYNGVLYWRFIQVNEQEAAELIEGGNVEFSQLPKRIQPAQKEIIKQETIKQEVQPEVIKEAPKIEEKKIKEVKVEEGFVGEKIKQKKIELEEDKAEEKEEKNKKELDIFDKKAEESSNNLRIDNLKDIEAAQKSQIFGASNLANIKDIEDTKMQLLNEIKRQASNLIGRSGKKLKEKKKSEFEEKIERFFEESDIEVVQEIKFKKKDGSGLVKISDSSEMNGKEYLCLIRDKKIITESDIMEALKTGHKVMKPILLISTGELNKKAEEWIDYFGDLFVFKKMK